MVGIKKMKISLIRAAIVIFVLSPFTPVAAGPYEDAIAAYNSGDYATALQRLRRLAEHGECVAQYKLGFMYERGQGVIQNLVMAYMWYDLSAAQCQAAAENRDYIAKLMTPAQVTEAHNLAHEWTRPKQP
jgi:TPR repeat protein